jgi:arylsulfatase A-like enzyme
VLSAPSLGFAAVVVTALLPFTLSCAGGPRRPAPAIVLVSVDTLRPDHLGCYGYPRPTSPEIDRFREEAILFEEAVAHAPSTLSSHASFFSSLLPPHHGASVLNQSAIAPAVPLLAEVLRDAGFATASFNGGGQLHPAWGLDRGFDVYESFAESDGDRLGEDTLRERLTAARVWLESVRDEPFFLFLHTYEVHHPYTPEPERLALMENGYEGRLPGRISIRVLEKINDGTKALRPGDLEHIVATYDAEISSADAGFGELLDQLRELGRYDSSLLIFTSDHGEAFGERGRIGWHGDTLYDEQLRIPLVIRLPGGRLAGTTVKGQVRGVDLAPTVLSLLGLPIPEEFSGADLDLASRAVPEPAWALAGIDGSPNALAVRTPRWKWYEGRLYDLVADPGERTDVASQHPEVERDLAGTLADLVRSRAPAGETPIEVDEDLRERLEALGYVN